VVVPRLPGRQADTLGGFSPISALLVSMEPLGFLKQLTPDGSWLTRLSGMLRTVRLMASVQMLLLRLAQFGVFRTLLRGSAVVVLFHCHSPQTVVRHER
jgi:hypothetical protein